MATPAILAIHRAVTNSGIRVTGHAGVVVCRKIAGTNRWSQHAFGNATDYYGSATEMERLYQFLLARKASLGVATLCHNRRGGCTTAHTDHVHVDAVPTMTGVPACAGGTPIPQPDRDNGSNLRDNVNGHGGERADPEGAELIPNIASVTDFLGLLVQPDTWLRVLWGVGGFVTLGAGLLMLAREMGLPVPTPIEAGKAVANVVGPGKIVKAVT